ncbi:NupC/NupG family nucleoside CNT transporter [Chachezhania antarctica]|uniref:NupC/NupG family nucleoside CNT transporter n=1 Tax=Chachezhania antarctica TaxID=2340860 RepID=UPI000EAE83A5|nr:nucleoside transporter C-terminal domain-containing protein [Chachezhania antarctica]|tara:strand:+ start:3764 stop:5026 length:1263 start_codon:yes stop_codon:yes gene_type:complete
MFPVQLQSVIGLIVIPVFAWAIRDRSQPLDMKHAARIVAVGIGMQLIIAALMLNVPAIEAAFAGVSRGVTALQAATGKGVQLVFGYLGGGPPPFDVTNPANAFLPAFQAFPLILLVSALTSLLFYWGILQKVVKGFAVVLQRSMGVSGPIATSAAANIFMGMIEAPLFIKPYMRVMDRGALFAVMTVGLATIAGTVLVLYASIIQGVVPDAAGHLIVASVISAPAALMLAQLMVPTTPGDIEELPEDAPEDQATSSIDALTKGTQNGVLLLAGVVSTLIVFVAIVTIIDQILGAASGSWDLSLEKIFGWLFAPVAWLIGVPWEEASKAGSLLGIKTAVNEFVAFAELGQDTTLSERTRLIMTYALAGFANFGSVGIMIGGMSAIVPERRPEIVELGMKALVSGTLTTLMTGAVIGAMSFG